MSEPRVIPRSVQAEIVADLARGHRSTATIADRHHVPTDLVVTLRDTYGPDLGRLSDAAEMLRRPALRDAASAPAALAEASGEPAAPPKMRKCYQDGLTRGERRACRAWAGLPVNQHPAPKDARDRWIAAGRPMPTEIAWTTPAVVDVVDAPAVAASETASDDPVENQEEAPSGEWPACHCPYCDAASKDIQPEVTPDLEPAVDAPTPDAVELDAGDDFVAECVNCDTKLFAGRCPVCECPECGEPLDDLLTCPACTAARRAADWDRFYGECLLVPELADQCKDVADAVERLRDARAEHEYREGMVAKVARVIDELRPLVADDIARAVLDLIEAA